MCHSHTSHGAAVSLAKLPAVAIIIGPHLQHWMTNMALLPHDSTWQQSQCTALQGKLEKKQQQRGQLFTVQQQAQDPLNILQRGQGRTTLTAATSGRGGSPRQEIPLQSAREQQLSGLAAAKVSASRWQLLPHLDTLVVPSADNELPVVVYGQRTDLLSL